MAKLLTSDLLKGIPHGFSTREGGSAADLLPDAPLILAKQVHSPDVAVVEAPWDGDPPEVDALVAAKSGLVLGIVTADCQFCGAHYELDPKSVGFDAEDPPGES